MFAEAIEKIINNVDGAVAGLVMGGDGIAVASYGRAQDGADISTIGMELSLILRQVRKACALLEIGGVEELLVRSEKLTVVIRVLSVDYFLAIALRPDGNLGKGRYLMRVTAPRLQAEL